MIYVDHYGIVDLEILVHAVPLDPCTDADHGHETPGWRIGLVLYGGTTHVSALTYPTRAFRDTAFEAMCALMQHVAETRAGMYRNADAHERT